MSYDKNTVVHNKEIAKLVQEKRPRYYLKDIEEILELQQKVILEQLDSDKTIKLGKVLKLTPVTKEPQSHYDGIHKKKIMLSKRRVVKVDPLSALKQLNKDL